MLEGVGLAVTDLDGQYVLVNRAFACLTGYPEAELPGRGFASITHPGDLPADLQVIRQMLAGECSGRTYDKRYIRLDGGSVRVRTSVSLLDDSQGRPTHIIFLSEGVHEDNQVDAIRQQALNLSGELLRAEERERRRFARELHDSTAQLLVGLVMTLTQLRDEEPPDSRLQPLAAKALDLANQCSREVRELSYRLYPPMLQELGLSGALATYLDGIRKRSGVEVILDLAPDLGNLPVDVEMTIFRVIQESLANVIKHSGSPEARVALARSRHDVSLEISDRGRGFHVPDPDDQRAVEQLGVGIRSMRERAELLGGCLSIGSNHQGTRVALCLPLVRSNGKNADSDSR